MTEIPLLKKFDRYKASSFNSYNFKMPSRYDDILWMRVFKCYTWGQEIIRELDDDLSKLHILDVGCATGRLLSQFAEAGCQHLYGTDLAPNILEVAQQKISSYHSYIELKTADAESHIPWADNFFDVVTLTGVLHHFYRPNDAITEIYRVLKHNGCLIVIEPWFVPVLRQIVNFYLLFFPHDGDCRFHSSKGIISLLSSKNFKIMQHRKIARLSFMVVSIKKE